MTGSDELLEAFKKVLAAKQEAMRQHKEMLETQAAKDAFALTRQLVRDFRTGLTSIGIMSTRWSGFREQSLSLRLHDHLLQSAIAIMAMIEHGMQGPARREMRFMVEAAIKGWSSDRNGVGVVKDKVDALDALGAARFGEIVRALQPKLLEGAKKQRLVDSATNLYSQLSTHVHVSRSQISQDLLDFDNGKYFAFERVSDINRINVQFRQVLDLCLLAQFEAFDHGLLGDVFVNVFDDEPKWAFRKTCFVSAVSAHYDYKLERQTAK